MAVSSSVDTVMSAQVLVVLSFLVSKAYTKGYYPHDDPQRPLLEGYSLPSLVNGPNYSVPPNYAVGPTHPFGFFPGSYPYENAYPQYSYSYGVKDDYSGNDFGHAESRDGDTTNGQYHVLLPDGRLQIVTYIADENGYRANVQYERGILPGGGPVIGNSIQDSTYPLQSRPTSKPSVPYNNVIRPIDRPYYPNSNQHRPTLQIGESPFASYGIRPDTLYSLARPVPRPIPYEPAIIGRPLIPEQPYNIPRPYTREQPVPQKVQQQLPYNAGTSVYSTPFGGRIPTGSSYQPRFSRPVASQPIFSQFR